MAKKNIKPTISLDNRPQSPDIQSEPKVVPKGFVNIKPTKPIKNEGLPFNVYKGRVYKKLDNQYGMWADTGEVFRLENIK